ncbi:hypothetical protein HDU97_001895 [Phlyctochytrium planicorne]|nr:hypothetical protein HDU97_001895 [Phlyctochytrium planicorne]
MVSFNAILAVAMAAMTAPIAVQALAAPKETAPTAPNSTLELTYPTTPKETTSNWSSGDHYEPLGMLMQCVIYSSDGQPKDYFSDIGMYDSIAASKDGSFPSAFMGPMVYPDWTDFKGGQIFYLKDTRKVFTGLKARNLDCQFGESTGSISLAYHDAPWGEWRYECYRDNNRDVFTAHFGDDYAICRAIHYCLSLGPIPYIN